MRNTSVPDGVYEIDPDGPAGLPAYSVYCDMTTDAGGWTLALAYAHAGGTNETPPEGTAPTTPTGFTRMDNAHVMALPFTEVRFYCETSAHARVLHFKTSNPGAIAYMRGLGPNSLLFWQTGFIALVNHTSNLPASADSIVDCYSGVMCSSTSGIMLFNPFYLNAAHHWSIYSFASRWECDDFANGPSETTLHQIWFR